MKLETIERTFGMRYPKAFREIYEAGAMGWLCGEPQDKSHLFPNKLLEEEYYPYWNLCDFPDVEQSIGYLKKYIQESGGRWKEDVQVLPLAWQDEGYAFFFNAALGEENSSVFALTVDGDTARFSRSFENFICARLTESVLNRGMLPDHWWIQNQLQWLTPDHQAALTSGDPNVLENLLSQTDCWERTDYVSY